MTEDMQKRLDQVKAEIAAIEADSAPWRERREQILVQMRPLQKLFAEVNDEIKAIEEPLFDLQREKGKLAKRLGGKYIHVPPLGS